MGCQPVRIALLLGAITAVAVVSPARAQVAATPAPAATPANPCTRTIQVMECVPETYTKKVCTYKRVCKTEEYDTFRCECVNECREKVCCVTKRIPVMETVTKQVCKTITTNEERTVMKTCYKNVEECVNQKRLVELGHWECRERQALLGNLFRGNDCCDPCNNNCCPRTVQHKVWVCCPRYECCPVKVCKRVCYQVPVKVCVPVCKRVMETVTCQVCNYKCVQENQTVKYNVPVLRKVPCKATRTVSTCVPIETEVTCTRMVQRCVTREVACAPCCNPCDSCGGGHGSRLSGLFRSNGCCCR